jgi:hypothetical protein
MFCLRHSWSVTNFIRCIEIREERRKANTHPSSYASICTQILKKNRQAMDRNVPKLKSEIVWRRLAQPTVLFTRYKQTWCRSVCVHGVSVSHINSHSPCPRASFIQNIKINRYLLHIVTSREGGTAKWTYFMIHVNVFISIKLNRNRRNNKFHIRELRFSVLLCREWW